MNNQNNNQYGQCKFCGANNVRNPKTGKIFCSEKCWLKGRPQEVARPTQNLIAQPNWEAITSRKEESMSFLNAKNNAAILLAAAIKVGQLNIADALKLYEEATQTIYDIGNGKEGNK